MFSLRRTNWDTRLTAPALAGLWAALAVACGLAIAVKNARAEVKREAHYVTPHEGGDGALRDAVEYIPKAQGKWKRASTSVSAVQKDALNWSVLGS